MRDKGGVMVNEGIPKGISCAFVAFVALLRVGGFMRRLK